MDIGAYIVPGIAGIGAVLSILGFFAFVQANASDAAFKRRMASVKDHRAALRAQRMSETQSKPDRKLAAMESALAKFKLKDKLWDDSLRMKLARAGKRGRTQLIRFLFMQIVLPPVMAVAALAYYHFIFKPELFSLTYYAGVTLLGAAIGYFLPNILLENARHKRQAEILQGYPDALDLLTICVEAGMSIEHGLQRVAGEVGGYCTALAEELTLTTAELAYLGDRRQALENLSQRTGLTQVKAITSALIQAEKYGTSTGQALRVVSAESRMERLARAESKAQSLPAKMTVPMMIFFLPTLFIVILGPSIIQMMDAF